MDLKPAGQLRHRLFSLERLHGDPGLECRAVRPAGPFHVLLLPQLPLSWEQNPTLATCPNIGGHLNSPALPRYFELLLTQSYGGKRVLSIHPTSITLTSAEPFSPTA